MDIGIANRVVVITGASRGLGRDLATALSRAGARLGLFARDEVALKELAASLPGETVPVACDVNDSDAIARGFAVVARKFGTVDSVIANAGISPAAHRAHKLAVEDWQQTIAVNLTGAFLTARAAYPHLAASGRGRLVLTSSVMANSPRRGLSAYAASKAGIAGLTRALAADWATDAICVNAIAPGFFEAGLGTAFAESDRLKTQILSRTPLGRFGTTSELSKTVAFLAGDASAYLTGHVLAIDGGYGLG